MDCTFGLRRSCVENKTEGTRTTAKLDSKWRKKEQFFPGSGGTEH